MPSTSKVYADQFKTGRRNDVEYEQPDKFPLDFGKRFQPFPYLFQSYDFEQDLNWIWIGATMDKYFFMLFFGILLIIAGIGLIGVGATSNGGIAVLGALLLISGIVLLSIRHNMARNENHRRSICNLFAKSVQASEQWKAHGNRKIYGKDVFFTSESFQGCFNVLRDGSVEVIPSRINENAGLYVLKAAADHGENLQSSEEVV